MRKVLTGDVTKAARYIGVARKLLSQCRALGLPVLRRRIGEAAIEVRTLGGERVWIHAEGGGTLLVADSANARWKMVATHPLGMRSRLFGTAGADPGQFGTAFSIAADASRIYVTNTEQQALEVYSRRGTFIRRVAVANFPVTHVSAGGGYVAVVASVGGTNPSNDTVLVYDTDFNVVRSFAQIAEYAVGAVKIHQGRLYVGVAWNDQEVGIRVFDVASGEELWSYAGLQLCEGLDIYRGRLYAADSAAFRIKVFDATQESDVLYAFGEPGPEDGAAGLGQFEYYGAGPRGVAVDQSGVYVSDCNSGIVAEAFRFRDSLQRFTHAGKPIAKQGTYGSGKSQYSQPFSLCFAR